MLPSARETFTRNAVVGTLAAWTLRYAPIMLCGSEQLAAEFSWRFLAAQVGGLKRRQAASRAGKLTPGSAQRRLSASPTTEAEEFEVPF